MSSNLNRRHPEYWLVGGSSITGAHHSKFNLPNQDAIEWFPKEGQGSDIILAVADGHGDAKCFRSSEGANFAVTISINCLKELIQQCKKCDNEYSFIKGLAEDKLAKEITSFWHQKVKEHYNDNPFQSSELDLVELKKGINDKNEVIKNPHIAYGTTLITVCITSTFALFLQLGDGDILVCDSNGIFFRPIKPDSRLIANQTTSLSSAVAYRDFRVSFLQFYSYSPDIILLTTDGLPNSYISDEDFFKSGYDIKKMIFEKGWNVFLGTMETWMSDISELGSGDDVTIGIIYGYHNKF